MGSLYLFLTGCYRSQVVIYHTTIRKTSPKQQIQDDSLGAKSKTFLQSIEGTAFHDFFLRGMKLHPNSHQTIVFRPEELLVTAKIQPTTSCAWQLIFFFGSSQGWSQKAKHMRKSWAKDKGCKK